MSISMNDIKTLRSKTGAGFADCKNALEKANSDMDAAVKILKEMGMAAVEKRAGRKTEEGSIFIETKEHKAALAEVHCETDFVARNEDFQQLGAYITQEALAHDYAAGVLEPNDAMKEKLQNTIAKIKENMKIQRIHIVAKEHNEIFSHYTHGTPARLGAVVTLKSDTADILGQQEVQDFAFNCALHAVARTPLFLDKDTISDTYKKEQLDIITTQVGKLGKPEQISNGIIQGKWNKHATEICFLLQPWVHDEKRTVQNEINDISKKVGGNITISNFVVFILGENT